MTYLSLPWQMARLCSRTKHLEVTLPSSFSLELLEQLASILSWTAGRPEINAVLLCPAGPRLPCSFTAQEWEAMDSEQAMVALEQLRKLVFSMFYLPQTVVIDLGQRCDDLGLELSLGADIRVAPAGVQVEWNQLCAGRSPCSGGSSILALLVGDATARNWLLSGRELCAGELLACGFLAQTYWQPEQRYRLLQNIHRQAPVARIQTKRALLENIMAPLDQALETENKIASATLLAGDYRRGATSKGQSFCSPKDFSQSLREAAEQTQDKAKKTAYS